jgi:enterochelin esterase-like enzyme
MTFRLTCVTLLLLFSGVPARNHTAAQIAFRQPLDSPRLAALKRELESGHPEALEEFWRGVTREGAPLVEPIKGDDRNLLVTFLWRDAAEQKFVAVFPFARVNPLPHLLARMEGSDLWYKSYVLRRDARFEYLVSANDSLAPFAARDPADEGGWLAALRPDPLNPRRFVEPQDPESTGDQEYVSSLVELSGAPTQPFVAERAGAAKGRVELIRYESRVLKDRRRVWVYTPPGYTKEGGPYRLLVLFDGWQYTHQIPTPTILDNMIADGALPPTVAVMLDNPDRLRELYLNEPFADFVAGELVAWVRREYHVTRSPGESIIGGLSLGGVAASFTAMRHPEVFGNVLSQSGAYQYRPDDPARLIRSFATGARRPIRFYLEAGLMEVNETPSLLHENRHLRDVLEAKGYELTYSEFNGRHDPVCWRGSLSQGLSALTRPAPRRQASHRRVHMQRHGVILASPTDMNIVPFQRYSLTSLWSHREAFP